MLLQNIRRNECMEQKDIIENTNLVIDEAVKSLKHISNNISPHILNNFGLERAIENFIKKFESISDLKINFKSNMKNVRLKNNIEVILYRIVCEMINNTIKHSGASEANVRLALNGGVLTLDYSDNGCGFIVENALENSSGMGLSNIISRVESIKGEVKIDSNLGQGARFVIKINGVK